MVHEGVLCTACVLASDEAWRRGTHCDADDLAPSRRPGICLVRQQDETARRKAQKLKFKCFNDPVEFVAATAKIPASAGKGHIVLLPIDTTDYSLCAGLAAAIMGAYCATPTDFLDPDKEVQCGSMYEVKYKSPHLDV